MSKVLLTRADIADILGITESDIPQRVVDWSKAEVEKVLGKKYDLTGDVTQEIILRGNVDANQNYLLLDHINITEIKSITYRGLGVASGTETTISSADYHLETDTGMVYFNYNLWRNYVYTVKYSYGGDSIGDLDRQIQFLLIFKYLINYKSSLFSADKEVSSEKIGDYSVTYAIEDALSKPALIDKDIEKLKKIAGAGDNYFMGTI